eukprot:GILJ01025969.1.p2 GENE.GILJ01025969.1~~GILJ01025969.1.p2  ORF type:complete len:118 (+),score=9.39 GILJ01025969.1:270-623(+)
MVDVVFAISWKAKFTTLAVYIVPILRAALNFMTQFLQFCLHGEHLSMVVGKKIFESFFETSVSVLGMAECQIILHSQLTTYRGGVKIFICAALQQRRLNHYRPKSYQNVTKPLSPIG